MSHAKVGMMVWDQFAGHFALKEAINAELFAQIAKQIVLGAVSVF